MKSELKKILMFVPAFILIVILSVLIANTLFKELPRPIVSNYYVNMPVERIRLHNCSLFDSRISFCYGSPVYVYLKYDTQVDAVFNVVKEDGEKIRLSGEDYVLVDFIEYCGESYDPNVEMCLETVPEGNYSIDFKSKLEFSKHFGKYGSLYYSLIFIMIFIGTFFMGMVSRKK